MSGSNVKLDKVTGNFTHIDGRRLEKFEDEGNFYWAYIGPKNKATSFFETTNDGLTLINFYTPFTWSEPEERELTFEEEEDLKSFIREAMKLQGSKKITWTRRPKDEKDKFDSLVSETL